MSMSGVRPKSHAYDLFILVLTVLSLGIMVLLVLPLDQATVDLLNAYDNIVCFVFLADFAYRISRAPSRRVYFVNERGWLDLLGSIPSFGLLRYAVLLRLARLSRLARVARVLRPENRRILVDDLIRNRGQYAAFITFMSAFSVLVVASILVLEAESRSPAANIKTGGQAFWWAIVTITTVGYGDYYPVTSVGRAVAVFVMLAGIGIIGSLASILASVLVTGAGGEATSNGAGVESAATQHPPVASTGSAATAAPEIAAISAAAAPQPGPPGTAAAPAVASFGPDAQALQAELVAIRAELAALRRSLEPPAPQSLSEGAAPS